MEHPDLNLLVALDALLSEGSVAGAARRLRLSASAMSRTLTRLREVTGDPLLVRAGRGLVPTPRALALKETVGTVVDQAERMLRPHENLDLGSVRRTFTLRVSDGFVENFGPELIARVSAAAPGITLRFLQKATRDRTSLREGGANLETGVVSGDLGPEVRTQALFMDRFVGVVGTENALARDEMTPARYAAAKHILVSRRGEDRGLIDDALERLGLKRQITTIVGGFSAALTLARATELVATVPERHTGQLRAGLHSFALPFAVPEVTVSLMWHPRLDADPAHRWLRTCVRAVCQGGESKH